MSPGPGWTPAGPGPEGADDDPAPPTPLRRLWSRALWPLLAGSAIVAAALAVIIWLPLDSQVETDIKNALVGYETSHEIAWSETGPLVLPLSTEAEAALVSKAERRIERYAAGYALASFDTGREVARFLRIATTDRPWVVTDWDGEVVYFDFVRQTLHGEVVVRAGVRRAHQIGRSSQDKGRIVARRWLWADEVDVYEYALRDDGEAWRVVTTSHWGACDPDGGHAIEGARDY